MSPREGSGVPVLTAGEASTAQRFASRHRRALCVAMLGISLVVMRTYAAPFDLSALRPSTLFIQAGTGDQRTRAYVAGATWNWDWRRQYSFLTASGYFEADIGRWTTNDRGVSSSTWATQIGLTPVIRLQPSGVANRWFEKPAKWILQHLKKREGVDARLLDLRDFPMPFFDQAATPATPGRPPYKNEVVQRWTAAIAD